MKAENNVGVSAGKVVQITEELFGREFSKSTVSELCKKLDLIVSAYPFVFVDAMVIKVREEGRVRSRGILIAIGVNTKSECFQYKCNLFNSFKIP